jgi:hypothetical protein
MTHRPPKSRTRCQQTSQYFPTQYGGSCPFPQSVPQLSHQHKANTSIPVKVTLSALPPPPKSPCLYYITPTATWPSVHPKLSSAVHPLYRPTGCTSATTSRIATNFHMNMEDEIWTQKCTWPLPVALPTLALSVTVLYQQLLLRHSL